LHCRSGCARVQLLPIVEWRHSGHAFHGLSRFDDLAGRFVGDGNAYVVDTQRDCTGAGRPCVRVSSAAAGCSAELPCFFFFFFLFLAFFVSLRR